MNLDVVRLVSASSATYEFRGLSKQIFLLFDLLYTCSIYLIDKFPLNERCMLHHTMMHLRERQSTKVRYTITMTHRYPPSHDHTTTIQWVTAFNTFKPGI